jgi:hypothetical protein
VRGQGWQRAGGRPCARPACPIPPPTPSRPQPQVSPCLAASGLRLLGAWPHLSAAPVPAAPPRSAGAGCGDAVRGQGWQRARGSPIPPTIPASPAERRHPPRRTLARQRSNTSVRWAQDGTEGSEGERPEAPLPTTPMHTHAHARTRTPPHTCPSARPPVPHSALASQPRRHALSSPVPPPPSSPPQAPTPTWPTWTASSRAARPAPRPKTPTSTRCGRLLREGEEAAFQGQGGGEAALQRRGKRKGQGGCFFPLPLPLAPSGSGDGGEGGGGERRERDREEEGWERLGLRLGL